MPVIDIDFANYKINHVCGLSISPGDPGEILKPHT